MPPSKVFVFWRILMLIDGWNFKWGFCFQKLSTRQGVILFSYDIMKTTPLRAILNEVNCTVMRSMRSHRFYSCSFLDVSDCQKHRRWRIEDGGVEPSWKFRKKWEQRWFHICSGESIPRVSMVACGSHNVIAVTEGNSVSIVIIKANLTHWDWDNMASNFLTTFWNAFS